MGSTLRGNVFEMDSTLGSIGSRAEIISDISIKLGQLQVDMEKASIQGMDRFIFHECHREIRMLADLLGYVTDDLNESYEKAHEICNTIFAEVIGASEQ